MSSLLTAISSSRQSGDTLTVTWNRNQQVISDCSSSTTYFRSGKSAIVSTGTQGIVSGTVAGVGVKVLNFTNVNIGYSQNASSFTITLDAGTALPQSFFNSVEVVGKITLLTSNAGHDGHSTWSWTVSTPFFPDAHISEVIVR